MPYGASQPQTPYVGLDQHYEIIKKIYIKKMLVAEMRL